ncbi:flagellar motor protein [bacterium]|nr:flagellar motor protein [bacterium]
MIINWIGAIVGVAAILVGNAIEGGHIQALIQPTALMIVAGGTLGSTLLACTGKEVKGAMTSLLTVFVGAKHDYAGLAKEIIGLATAARKDGILSLEGQVGKIKNHFLSTNLRRVIDGYDPNVLKTLMEDQITHTEEEFAAVGKLWETAGGFAPTIGILGAVLGLIHVMANLSDSSKLGAGIAVAFVATVYGVGSANLFLIPLGNKVKKIGKEKVHEMEIVFIGITGIQEGLNPRVIEDRLHGLTGHGEKKGGAEAKKAA